MAHVHAFVQINKVPRMNFFELYLFLGRNVGLDNLCLISGKDDLDYLSMILKSIFNIFSIF